MDLQFVDENLIFVTTQSEQKDTQLWRILKLNEMNFKIQNVVTNEYLTVDRISMTLYLSLDDDLNNRLQQWTIFSDNDISVLIMNDETKSIITCDFNGNIHLSVGLSQPMGFKYWDIETSSFFIK